MKALDLINNLQKLIDRNGAVRNAEIIISSNNLTQDTIAGLIMVDNPDKYHYSHIHIANELSDLIKLCSIEYKMDEDMIIKNLIPICGFTTVDILKELE